MNNDVRKAQEKAHGDSGCNNYWIKVQVPLATGLSLQAFQPQPLPKPNKKDILDTAPPEAHVQLIKDDGTAFFRFPKQ